MTLDKDAAHTRQFDDYMIRKLDKDAAYTRQLDDYLMRRLDKIECSVEEMKESFLAISSKLDKISDSQENSETPIEAMRSVLKAGGMLKWSVSTIVVLCAGFAAIITAVEAFQRWLGK